MGHKANEMKELMGHLGGPVEEVSLEEETQVEVRSELPLEIMVSAKQDRVHTEKRSPRKVVIKRIHFK